MTIKILKNDTCPSISGKSTLKYQIGADDDDAILLRITGSSGGGFFSNEWIAFEKIQALLDAHPAEKPITSIVLYPLFRGKSVNTPSFLLAALVHEKVLMPMKGKQRCHEVGDMKIFAEKTAKLTSRTVKKKAPVKKKRVAKKKTTAKRRTARGS
ncbi:MAG: hypothetical protein PVH71_06180 [Chromatiales bacterium]|jgi:hypothetical protein